MRTMLSLVLGMVAACAVAWGDEDAIDVLMERVAKKQSMLAGSFVLLKSGRSAEAEEVIGEFCERAPFADGTKVRKFTVVEDRKVQMEGWLEGGAFRAVLCETDHGRQIFLMEYPEKGSGWAARRIDVAEMGKLDPAAKEILAKLEGTVIPEVDLTRATMVEAVNGVSGTAGVSFMLKGGEAEVAKAGKVTYQGKDVRLLEVVAEIARQCGRDAYVTSSAITLVPEGAELGKSEEVWKVVRVKVGDDAKKLLEGVRMPVVDFDNTSVEEAVDFLRVRTIEMDAGETEKKGIGFVERKPRGKEQEMPGYPLSEEERAALPMLTYSAKDVTFGAVLKEIARQAKLDVYLTTGGLLLRPAGAKAFESEREEAASLVEVIYRWEGK